MAGACGGAKNGDLMYVISRDRPGMCISPVITHSRAHMHFTFPITGETYVLKATNHRLLQSVLAASCVTINRAEARASLDNGP